MTARRSISVALALAATVVLVTGSAGFTSVSADRSVSVAVVDAEDAYVDVSVCTRSVSQNGSDPVAVTVANQYTTAFTVESISWSEEAHPNRTRVSPGVELEPGESRTFEEAFGDGAVTVRVTGGLDATVTVDVGPQCSGKHVAETATAAADG